MHNSTQAERVAAHNKYYRASGFMAVIAWFENYFNFTGRSSRDEVWWLGIFTLPMLLIIAWVYYELPEIGITLLALLPVPWIALMTRRYRDAGMRGDIGALQIALTFIVIIVVYVLPETWAYLSSWLLALLELSGTAMGVIALFLPSRALPTVEVDKQ
ncbi:MAG: DUF805 domain-containing protein [Lactobacillus sp.]|jgi:uncharacterized membrane protein YhaH (DUF805 family)|nr:DUF805 domain-containing protein [Lactobacillus sp.]MCI2032691.1 DUF805 domain-containing protein [Lactobacillus sp.]